MAESDSRPQPLALPQDENAVLCPDPQSPLKPYTPQPPITHFLPLCLPSSVMPSTPPSSSLSSLRVSPHVGSTPSSPRLSSFHLYLFKAPILLSLSTNLRRTCHGRGRPHFTNPDVPAPSTVPGAQEVFSHLYPLEKWRKSKIPRSYFKGHPLLQT